jgi:hypothetical protein
MKNLFQGFSLLGISEFVYDNLEIAFALMDRFFCPSQHRDIEAAQIYIAKMAFINMYYFETNTVVIGWFCFKLAGATVSAIAISKLDAFYVPIYQCEFFALNN